MPSYAYDVDNIRNAPAPTRDEIDGESDLGELKEMQYTAEEMEISLRTKLEFFSVDDPRAKGRRVAALIFWRTALMHIKRRRNEIHSEARRAEREQVIA